MPKYVIERELAGAGRLSADQLKKIAQTSCDTIQELDSRLQWQHSYVTTDKLYCVYIANDEATLREHARRGGFPINKISKVSTIFDPVTAEAALVEN